MARLFAPLMRRQFLHLAAGAAVFPLAACLLQEHRRLPRICRRNMPAHPFAERLAAYAHNLRYSDLDAATIERVKSHLIDTLGCGIAALDEEPVRHCREDCAG